MLEGQADRRAGASNLQKLINYNNKNNIHVLLL